MSLAVCATSIDWDATGSMLQGWGALGACVTVVVAAMLGRATLKDWRRQKQNERAMDTAERALTAAYKAKDSLEGIRSNLTLAGELKRAAETLRDSGVDTSSMRDAERRRWEQAQAILNRINSHQSVWADLYSVMPSTKAFFGAEVEKHLDTLAHQRHIVGVSAESYAEDDGSDRDYSASIRADIWRQHGARAAQDPVATRVDAAIAALEAVMLPILRADYQPPARSDPAAA